MFSSFENMEQKVSFNRNRNKYRNLGGGHNDYYKRVTKASGLAFTFFHKTCFKHYILI